MNTDQKTTIKGLLIKYCEHVGSQNKAAKTLTGVSITNINHIINDKWDSISDAMWRNVGSQVGFNTAGWQNVNTTNYEILSSILMDAQMHHNVYAVVGDAGCGKSATNKIYAESYQLVYLLECSEFWNRKYFLEELLTAMGENYEGLSVADMVNTAVRKLKTLPNPLIILDEADKLTDSVLYFFITLYNKTKGNCGIVMTATDHLEKRITKGVRLNRKGYKEIKSRLGNKFIKLRNASKNDVTGICNANGITDVAEIAEIFNESESDLRRVERMIHKSKLRNKGASDQDAA